MICVALAELTYEECLAAVNALNFAELRLDLLDLTAEQRSTLFAANSNLIATCRPGKFDHEEKTTILLQAINAGAAYVDVEIETEDAIKQEILRIAHAKDCKVIISYHNFEETPEQTELEHILAWCAAFNPDIIKIACMAHSERDNARLLGLLDTQHPMVVLGMGESGKITRIVSPLLGGLWTFAAYSPETMTAPGQLCQEELATLLQTLQTA